MKVQSRIFLCIVAVVLLAAGCAGTPDLLKTAENRGLAELTSVQKSIADLSAEQIQAKRTEKLAEIASRHLKTLQDLQAAGVLTPDSVIEAEVPRNAGLDVLNAALATDAANYAQLLARVERAKQVWSASLGYRTDVVEVDTAFLMTVKDYLTATGDAIPPEYQAALQQMIDSLLGNTTNTGGTQ